MIGQEVTVKIDGRKYRGTVINLERDTTVMDVTRSGILGGPVDSYRRVVPGRTTTTLTIDLDPRPIKKRGKK